MLVYMITRFITVVIGVLYPAFCSFKAVKTRNARAYIRWMTYWISYALYTAIEFVADPLLAFWFPFYFELKVCVVLCLITPVGTNFTYRVLVHPTLEQHEDRIEGFIRDFKSHVVDYSFRFGTELMAAASDRIWQAAIRGPPQRNVVDSPGLRRAFSYTSLGRAALDEDLNQNLELDVADVPLELGDIGEAPGFQEPAFGNSPTPVQPEPAAPKQRKPRRKREPLNRTKREMQRLAMPYARCIAQEYDTERERRMKRRQEERKDHADQ